MNIEQYEDARRSYEPFQSRGVVTIDTSTCDAGELGIVALIPVGMSHVESAMLTAVAGKHLAKGDEFGFFRFGGSDVHRPISGRSRSADRHQRGHRLAGTPAARCRSVPRSHRVNSGALQSI